LENFREFVEGMQCDAAVLKRKIADLIHGLKAVAVNQPEHVKIFIDDILGQANWLQPMAGCLEDKFDMVVTAFDDAIDAAT
jgi:hypothetical protein